MSAFQLQPHSPILSPMKSPGQDRFSASRISSDILYIRGHLRASRGSPLQLSPNMMLVITTPLHSNSVRLNLSCRQPMKRDGEKRLFTVPPIQLDNGLRRGTL